MVNMTPKYYKLVMKGQPDVKSIRNDKRKGDKRWRKTNILKMKG